MMGELSAGPEKNKASAAAASVAEPSDAALIEPLSPEVILRRNLEALHQQIDALEALLLEKYGIELSDFETFDKQQRAWVEEKLTSLKKSFKAILPGAGGVAASLALTAAGIPPELQGAAATLSLTGEAFRPDAIKALQTILDKANFPKAVALVGKLGGVENRTQIVSFLLGLAAASLAQQVGRETLPQLQKGLNPAQPGLGGGESGSTLHQMAKSGVEKQPGLGPVQQFPPEPGPPAPGGDQLTGAARSVGTDRADTLHSNQGARDFAGHPQAGASAEGKLNQGPSGQPVSGEPATDESTPPNSGAQLAPEPAPGGKPVKPVEPGLQPGAPHTSASGEILPGQAGYEPLYSGETQFVPLTSDDTLYDVILKTYHGSVTGAYWAQGENGLWNLVHDHPNTIYALELNAEALRTGDNARYITEILRVLHESAASGNPVTAVADLESHFMPGTGERLSDVFAHLWSGEAWRQLLRQQGGLFLPAP